jgi:hypothetical protein
MIVGCRTAKLWLASRGAFVDMVQAAEDGPCADGAGGPAFPRQWRGEAQAAVRSRRVVVGHVFPEHGPEVRLVEDEDVVEALI